VDVDNLNQLRAGFDEYLNMLSLPLTPDDNYLPYEYPYIAEAKWRFMIDEMIKDDLREFTNRLHEWRDMLRRWHAWNMVVSTKESELAWDYRREFMGPLMHTCLLMPSSMRDLAIFIGTNILHQIRLHSEPGYLDVIEGDPSPSDPSPRELTRRKKENRLASLSAPLEGSGPFMSSIREIDSNDFRKATKDYRNLNSHAIGPRIAIGQTRLVSRHCTPEEVMEPQSDGTIRFVKNKERYVVGYGFGGIEPISLDVARSACLDQYFAVRACFDHFTSLIQLHCNKLPRVVDLKAKVD
jgi:hypothetical protein